MRDGDGWVTCSAGHRHWGLFGAAGLLLAAVDPAGVVRVLLQHRAAWSHHGDTWGIPGGARGSVESGEQAALREAVEETGLDPLGVTLGAASEEAHGGWSYTTVLATAAGLLPVHAEDQESTAVAWVALAEVDGLPLHPGFAGAWPALQPWIASLAAGAPDPYAAAARPLPTVVAPKIG